MVYGVMTLSRVIVAGNGCVTMKRVYSKNIPLSVARTEPELLKTERFGKFKNKNVSNQTWKAWQTWFATVRFAFSKFFNLLQARSTSRIGLRIKCTAWTLIEEVETEIAMRQSLKEKPKDPGLAQVYITYRFIFCNKKQIIFTQFILTFRS